MRHVVQAGEQEWPITLTVHDGTLTDVVFIDTGGYEDIEVAITAIPALITALHAIYTEHQEDQS